MVLVLCGTDAIGCFRYKYCCRVLASRRDYELVVDQVDFGAKERKSTPMRLRHVMCEIALLICAIPSLGFGSEPALKPLAVVCSSDQAAIKVGEIVTIRAWANPAVQGPLTYNWTASAGIVHGANQEMKWDLSSLDDGIYKASVTVSNTTGFRSDCSVSVDVVDVPRDRSESGREILLRGDQEAVGYGLYSYLLFGSRPTEATRDRYLKILAAYLNFDSVFALEKVNYKPSQLNITYLPLELSGSVDSSAEWLLDHYDFERARSLLDSLPGERKDGIYFVSSAKPLGSHAAPGHLMQDLTTVPTSPSDLIAWWTREFLNQAAQEHFWEPRTAELLGLRLRTTISVLAAGVPSVKQSLGAWIQWTK